MSVYFVLTYSFPYITGKNFPITILGIGQQYQCMGNLIPIFASVAIIQDPDVNIGIVEQVLQIFPCVWINVLVCVFVSFINIFDIMYSW